MTNWFHLYSGFKAKIKWIISPGHTSILYLTFYHFAILYHSIFLFPFQFNVWLLLYYSTCTTPILYCKLDSIIWWTFLFFTDRLISKHTYFCILGINHNRAKAYGSNFLISIHTTYVMHLLWNPYAVPNSYNLACNKNDENSKCFSNYSVVIKQYISFEYTYFIWMNDTHTRAHNVGIFRFDFVWKTATIVNRLNKIRNKKNVIMIYQSGYRQSGSMRLLEKFIFMRFNVSAMCRISDSITINYK